MLSYSCPVHKRGGGPQLSTEEKGHLSQKGNMASMENERE